MSKKKFVGLALASVIFLLLESEASVGSVSTKKKKNPCRALFDFEDPRQANCFKSKSGTAIRISTDKAKHGLHSLKWSTTGASRFRYNRRIEGDELRRGGIKVWLYKTTPNNNRKLKVALKGERPNVGKRPMIASFTVNLGFKGWRAIWVAYSECKKEADSLRPPAAVTRVQFILNQPHNQQDTIYIDILEFVKKMSKQSRDNIVPPFTRFGARYDSSNTFQQAYRWSQQSPTSLPITIDASRTRSLEHIENRLKNWYFNEKKTSYDFTGIQRTRWDSLLVSIDEAYERYDQLDLANNPPSLFCRNCKFGNRDRVTSDRTNKFDFITMKVLLPLAIEHHFRSRDNEISKTAEEEVGNLNSGNLTMVENSIKNIAGVVGGRKDEFYNHLKTQRKPYSETTVKTSIELINSERLKRIFQLLDYIEDQGWAAGSAIGSLDHEMNRDGAGFMHTLFLLKDSLSSPANKGRLLNFIETAKWYCEFGEVYQSTFEFSGTTADRMITNMLFRLMIVLVMPSNTTTEKRERQRDMDALKRWIDNALTINKAFGGVIKPDYTGFHHKAIYASAYTPQAFHTAAQVQYLLEGTDFALSTTSKSNLRKALEVLRLTAVKYSTPNSVNGRLPQFDNSVLVKILPAYAYISVSYKTLPKLLSPTPPTGISVPYVGGAEMFLRLYDTSEQVVAEYLGNGGVQRGKSYMNSLGSLEIMSMVENKVQLMKISAEPSPEGHWSKNFAAFSVHRRKDWAVTVKGFNNFVWDFEGKGKQNPYGMFASHGAMLVANSEESLKAHDVSAGWDWTKVPGATTMSLQLDEMRLVEARNFSPSSTAGGVTFQGTQSLSNGAFGMDFHQPKYRLSRRNTNIPELSFKKSVFFFQNLIVCLGSDIGLKKVAGEKAQTTLFQDKLIIGSSSSIEVNGVRKAYSNPFTATTPAIPQGKSYAALVDTKGNSYYIPQSSASSLKVRVQDQTQLLTSRYATAWFEHSAASPTYEYVVYVKTPSYESDTESLWKEQNRNGLYTIEKQDDKAHVVKFHKSFVMPSTTLSSPVFGYVVFDSTASLPNSGGPIKRVSKKCLLMAEETTHSLHLSISYPNLDFSVPVDFTYNFKNVGEREMYYIESKENTIEVTLNNVEVMKRPRPPTKVHGSPPGYTPDVQVKSSSPSNTKGNVVVFTNLKNGFSIEATLKKYVRDPNVSSR